MKEFITNTILTIIASGSAVIALLASMEGNLLKAIMTILFAYTAIIILNADFRKKN